jgi:hypothetical protein
MLSMLLGTVTFDIIVMDMILIANKVKEKHWFIVL